MNETFTITLTEEEMAMLRIALISRAGELKQMGKEEEVDFHCELADRFKKNK
jgi:hypothetical protein